MRMPSPNFSAPLLKKRNFSYQRNGIRENYIKGFYNNSIPILNKIIVIPYILKFIIGII